MGKQTYFATTLLMDKPQFLQEIDGCIKEIDSLRTLNYTASEFKLWKKRVESLLIHGLGESSKQVDDFRWITFYDAVAEMNSRDSWAVEYEPYDAVSDFQDGLCSACTQLLAIKEDVDKHFADTIVTDKDIGEVSLPGKKVFIVHGHDEKLLLAVEKAIRTLDLEPIVLRDQPDAGMTLIQKFEKNSGGVGFVVFLLTNDETAIVRKTKKTESHARQNVIFEMGYFFNEFRRSDGSHRGILALLQEGVTKPGDIDGLVYCQYHEGDDGWKLRLAKELSAAGVLFDQSKVLEM